MHRGIDREARRDDEQGVAVGRRAHYELGADYGIGTGPIVDDYALAERTAQRRCDRAPENIGGAAGRKRHDDAYRPGGKFLCRWIAVDE